MSCYVPLRVFGVGCGKGAAAKPRTGRGTSGSPVVMPAAETERLPGDLHWKRLGAHSARLDVGTRDRRLNEALSPNCAWHADILLTLTET
jgi:hypothetical protein